MSKEDSLFLTQGVAASRVRKQAVQDYITQVGAHDLTEINSQTDQLLAAVQAIRAQETVSHYRQLKRQMKQARITTEAELSKIEKITFIDLEYSRKCLRTEGSPCYENILQVLQHEERQNRELLQRLSELEGRLRGVEEEVG